MHAGEFDQNIFLRIDMRMRNEKKAQKTEMLTELMSCIFLADKDKVRIGIVEQTREKIKTTIKIEHHKMYRIL